jgi:hypothetical protein
MHATTEIFEILRKLPPNDAERLLVDLGKTELLKAWHKREHIQFVLDLLNKGLSAGPIIVRLCAKYSVSRATAYRRLSDALSHPCRYRATGKVKTMSNPIHKGAVRMSIFIPCKRARVHFAADAIIEHPGMASLKSCHSELYEFGQLVAALVPNVILFHAVFVKPEPIRLEIIHNRICFLLFRGDLLYLGRVNDGFTVAASHPWRELSVCALPDDELALVDIDALLAQYDPTRWALEHQQYLQADTRISIDIAKHLRPFVEVSADE